ncbi:MAG: hypothetical protein KY429_04140 [Actinobacteria bacterium]|nr:hypothetical protein [Actinomycetota bacterium]
MIEPAPGRTPFHTRAGSLALAVLMAAVLAACDGPSRQREEEPPPTAKFQVLETRGIDAQDRPEAQAAASGAVPGVTATVNAYYNAAFIEKGKWGQGTHPDLASLFTADIQPQVAPQLGALALADIAPAITKVNPTKQEVPILTFLIEPDMTTPLAVATVLFEATATAVEKENSPVKIAHTATFWLVKEGDAYKIAGFKTHLVADSEVRTGWLPPPEGFLAT